MSENTITYAISKPQSAELQQYRHVLLWKQMAYKQKWHAYLKQHPWSMITLSDPEEMMSDYCEFIYALQTSDQWIYENTAYFDEHNNPIDILSWKQTLVTMLVPGWWEVILQNEKANALTPQFLDEIMRQIIKLHHIDPFQTITIRSAVGAKQFPIVFSSWMRLDYAAKYHQKFLYDTYLKEVIDGIYYFGGSAVSLTIELEWLSCWWGLEIALQTATSPQGKVIIDPRCILWLPELKKWFIPGWWWIPLGLRVFGIKNLVTLLIEEFVPFDVLPDKIHNGFIVRWKENQHNSIIDVAKYNGDNLAESLCRLEDAEKAHGNDYSWCKQLIEFCVCNPDDFTAQRQLEYDICAKLFSQNKTIQDLIKNFG